MGNDLLANLPLLWHGMLMTISFALASMCLGFWFALLMASLKYSNHPVGKTLVDVMIFFICGTPLLVQIFLLYYGLSQFEWLRESLLWFILREPSACVLLALTLNTACYTTVLLTGAIHAVPENEKAAAFSLGFSKGQTFRRIILPRAMHFMMPAYSNEVIMIAKNTSLASTITLLDLMGVTQLLIADTYQTLQWYVVAGLCYLTINALLLLMVRKLSIRKLSPYGRE